jgi:hypothetical protein
MNTVAAATLTAGDIDGDPIAFQILNSPAHGQLTSFNPTAGTFSYLPDANFAGNDVFTFRASDGLTNSTVATVNIAVNATSPVFTGYEFFSDGRFVLHVLAPPGPAYVIESSTNLFEWLPISTNTTPESPYDFVDSDAPNYPLRFYRVKQ